MLTLTLQSKTIMYNGIAKFAIRSNITSLFVKTVAIVVLKEKCFTVNILDFLFKIPHSKLKNEKLRKAFRKD